MGAGRLRQRIRIEALVVELDSDGAQQETWVDAFGWLSADIQPLSGRELLAAQAVQGKVSGRIRIRYRPGIEPSMRIVHRDTVYNIEALIPDADSGVRWITALTSTGVNEG